MDRLPAPREDTILVWLKLVEGTANKCDTCIEIVPGHAKNYWDLCQQRVGDHRTQSSSLCFLLAKLIDNQKINMVGQSPFHPDTGLGKGSLVKSAPHGCIAKVKRNPHLLALMRSVRCISHLRRPDG